MNATKKFAASIILLIVASAFAIPALIKETRTPDGGQTQSADFVLYYGSTCPHCKVVEQYINENGIPAKIDILQKEVYENQDNQKEFVAAAGACGLDQKNLGVPMLWDAKNRKCYTGSQPIIDFLKQQAAG